MASEIDLLIKNFEKLIKAIGSKRNQNRMGSIVVDLIYKRVKAGFGVNATNLDPSRTKQVKLKPLKSSYINRRKKATLGRFGSPGRSNLTLTGQMLEAFGFKIVNGVIHVRVNDRIRRDGRFSNSDIAEFVSDDRPWLALTRTEFRILTREIEKIISMEIKRLFT